MNSSCRLWLWALVLPFLAGSAPAAVWQTTASQLALTGTFSLPEGDTLVVDGLNQLQALDLDLVDWSRGGRLVLSGVTISDQGPRASTFPIVLEEGQELLIENSRIDCTSSMFIVDGAEVQSQATTLSAGGTVFTMEHPQSRLALQSTRFGASATALQADLGSLELDACVFLTNTQALVTGELDSLVIRDCLFQANEIALDISGERMPVLQNVDIVDSRYWDVINRSPSHAVELGDVFLGEGDLDKVQGLVVATNLPLAPRWPVYESASPLLVPGTILIGEVPLTFVPQGVTTVDAIPCRESRYLVYLSEHPYIFPAEPALVTDTPQITLPTHLTGMRFVRVTAELGRWQ